ncbi:MAG TPA: sulfite exporter TauE/SafE family protein [Myxococcota bacterium]
MSDLLSLSAVLFIAFVVESAVGFGSALFVVALGAQLVALDHLLPVFQPLSVLLSTTIVLRERAHLDLPFLSRRVLPAMLPGVVVGMVIWRLWPGQALLLLVGPSIAGLALIKLVDVVNDRVPAPLSPTVSNAVLALAGVLHGMFGTSGPPVVWVAARTLVDKARFRATLSLLWLALSAILVVGYAIDGSLNTTTLGESVLLLPALVVGYVVGNVLHHRVPQRAFGIGVCLMLIASGLALTLRAVG